ncbi:MAG: hypothetical protein ABIW19_13785 [Vicinamibacterales bacterium]
MSRRLDVRRLVAEPENTSGAITQGSTDETPTTAPDLDTLADAVVRATTRDVSPAAVPTTSSMAAPAPQLPTSLPTRTALMVRANCWSAALKPMRMALRHYIHVLTDK